MSDTYKEMDMKEIEFADTVFVRDIDSRVFQAIAYKCVAGIEGIALAGGNIIDSLLGRESGERIKGIYVDQDQKNHSVNLKVEVHISYGISIPEKAEEIQSKVAEEVSRLTGLHVGCVHVVFKNIIPEASLEKMLEENPSTEEEIEKVLQESVTEYSDDF